MHKITINHKKPFPTDYKFSNELQSFLTRIYITTVTVPADLVLLLLLLFYYYTDVDNWPPYKVFTVTKRPNKSALVTNHLKEFISYLEFHTERTHDTGHQSINRNTQ